MSCGSPHLLVTGMSMWSLSLKASFLFPPQELPLTPEGIEFSLIFLNNGPHQVGHFFSVYTCTHKKRSYLCAHVC